MIDPIINQFKNLTKNADIIKNNPKQFASAVISAVIIIAALMYACFHFYYSRAFLNLSTEPARLKTEASNSSTSNSGSLPGIYVDGNSNTASFNGNEIVVPCGTQSLIGMGGTGNNLSISNGSVTGSGDCKK